MGALEQSRGFLRTNNAICDQKSIPLKASNEFAVKKKKLPSYLVSMQEQKKSSFFSVIKQWKLWPRFGGLFEVAVYEEPLVDETGEPENVDDLTEAATPRKEMRHVDVERIDRLLESFCKRIELSKKPGSKILKRSLGERATKRHESHAKI